LRAIAEGGRDGFYRGPFGTGLQRVGAGEFDDDDLGRRQAEWIDPLGLDALGHRLWTIPPNSQGYLALAGAAVADRLELPDDAGDPTRVHLLIEAAAAVGHDRPTVLHDQADGAELLSADRIGAAVASIHPDRVVTRPVGTATGDTTFLATADADGTAVSLIQSNAADYGAHLVEPTTGTFLHNRGIGFSVDPEHPAAYGPARRPPHTLSPLAVSRPDGSLRAVLGTMGGDSQPQILLQLLVRMLVAGEEPATTLAAPRWILADPTGQSFDTWSGDRVVVLEDTAPSGWTTGLGARGHDVQHAAGVGGRFGHAHIIERRADGWVGATEPRALIGSAAGL
jgi:gamma-glutamyltranspeptidase/glutathione hydrolase